MEDDEVNTFVDMIRHDILNSAQVDVQQNDTLILFKAWSQSTELTLEQFLDSELLRNQYEEGTYLSEMYEYLKTEKLINSMEEFKNYQRDLFEKQKKST